MSFRCIQEHQEFNRIVKVDEVVEARPQYVGKNGWWENLADPDDDDQAIKTTEAELLKEFDEQLPKETPKPKPGRKAKVAEPAPAKPLEPVLPVTE